MAEQALREKERAEHKRELAGRCAQAAYHAAMDERHPMPLRKYYAALALFYDRKARQ